MTSYEKYEQIRNKKGLKNADVARLAHIPPSTFTDWKQGKSIPKIRKLNLIAYALGCTFDELCDDTEDVFTILGIDDPKMEEPLPPLHTEEEVRLLTYFAQLPPEKQDVVLNLIKTMI